MAFVHLSDLKDYDALSTASRTTVSSGFRVKNPKKLPRLNDRWSCVTCSEVVRREILIESPRRRWYARQSSWNLCPVWLGWFRRVSLYAFPATGGTLKVCPGAWDGAVEGRGEKPHLALHPAVVTGAYPVYVVHIRHPEFGCIGPTRLGDAWSRHAAAEGEPTARRTVWIWGRHSPPPALARREPKLVTRYPPSRAGI